MTEQPDRVEQFKADLRELRVADPAAGKDRLAARLGLAAMGGGIALGIAAYFMSHGTTNPLAQRDALVLAVLGVAVAVAGGALYLKGALAGFLRFWLVRDLHERRIQTDRVIDGLGPGSAGGDRPADGESH